MSLLYFVLFSGRVLKENECLSLVLKQTFHPICLKLHHFHSPTFTTIPQNATARSLIPVYYDLEQGVQRYQSVITSPDMKASEVLKCALLAATPSESVDDFSLVLVTPEKGTTLS